MNSSHEVLLAKNIVLLDTSVNGEMADHVYECLTILEARGAPEIEVRIFTNGGSVRVGLHIYDTLCRYNGKKIGLVSTFARSMGAIILQACDERVCLKHAAILIHHVNTQSISLDVLDNPRRLAKLRESMWADQKALYEILAKRTGKSHREIRDACKKDQDMNADQAKAFGLIDRIESGKQH